MGLSATKWPAMSICNGNGFLGGYCFGSVPGPLPFPLLSPPVPFLNILLLYIHYIAIGCVFIIVASTYPPLLIKLSLPLASVLLDCASPAPAVRDTRWRGAVVRLQCVGDEPFVLQNHNAVNHISGH